MAADENVYRIVRTRDGKPILGARRFLSRGSLAGYMRTRWGGMNMFELEPFAYRIQRAVISEWEDVTGAFIPHDE